MLCGVLLCVSPAAGLDNFVVGESGYRSEAGEAGV